MKSIFFTGTTVLGQMQLVCLLILLLFKIKLNILKLSYFPWRSYTPTYMRRRFNIFQVFSDIKK